VAPKDARHRGRQPELPMYHNASAAPARSQCREINWLGSMPIPNARFTRGTIRHPDAPRGRQSRDVLAGGAGTTSDSHIYPTRLNGPPGHPRFK